MEIDAGSIDLLSKAGAAVLVLLCFKLMADVFKAYVQAKESKQASSVLTSAESLVNSVRELTVQVKSLTEDVAHLARQVAVVQDRERALMERTVPTIEGDIQRTKSRITMVEQSLVAVQTHLGMAPHATPPLGVPRRISTEDDR